MTITVGWSEPPAGILEVAIHSRPFVPMRMVEGSEKAPFPPCTIPDRPYLAEGRRLQQDQQLPHPGLDARVSTYRTPQYLLDLMKASAESWRDQVGLAPMPPFPKAAPGMVWDPMLERRVPRPTPAPAPAGELSFTFKGGTLLDLVQQLQDQLRGAARHDALGTPRNLSFRTGLRHLAALEAELLVDQVIQGPGA